MPLGQLAFWYADDGECVRGRCLCQLLHLNCLGYSFFWLVWLSSLWSYKFLLEMTVVFILKD